jgi:hypothetical protein
VTLERREQTPLEKPQDELRPAKQRYWTPSPFESLIGGVLIFVWIGAIVVVICHEQPGFVMSTAYVLLGIIGAVVSWLLLWPLLRIMIHWMDD